MIFDLSRLAYMRDIIIVILIVLKYHFELCSHSKVYLSYSLLRKPIQY